MRVVYFVDVSLLYGCQFTLWMYRSRLFFLYLCIEVVYFYFLLLNVSCIWVVYLWMVVLICVCKLFIWWLYASCLLLWVSVYFMDGVMNCLFLWVYR
jgi:hypothetical protein